ncbi:hypothetical protein [Sansalvadorimonas verongulae]|uniref:hypothetical protein n=1 Tax=Sansalvadorimonas verongulae TaxID=2172824 RepID=UPI0012BBA4C0|nr:hypothetical protein [Sansalvadorimonas verongulae]MTI15123.1 hypothetical protein [Sansalvadorimonas verongulae]
MNLDACHQQVFHRNTHLHYYSELVESFGQTNTHALLGSGCYTPVGFRTNLPHHPHWSGKRNGRWYTQTHDGILEEEDASYFRQYHFTPKQWLTRVRDSFQLKGALTTLRDNQIWLLGHIPFNHRSYSIFQSRGQIPNSEIFTAIKRYYGRQTLPNGLVLTGYTHKHQSPVSQKLFSITDQLLMEDTGLSRQRLCTVLEHLSRHTYRDVDWDDETRTFHWGNRREPVNGGMTSQIIELYVDAYHSSNPWRKGSEMMLMAGSTSQKPRLSVLLNSTFLKTYFETRKHGEYRIRKP